MIVHPTFDLATGTWFVDGAEGAEARTIATLLAKMPSGTRVRDYYPGGYAVSCGERGFSINALRYSASPPKLRPQREGAAWTPRQPGKIVPRVRHVRRRVIDPCNSKYDHESVLNMWAHGFNGTEIAKRLGISKSAVQYVVGNARVMKDTRAVRRGGPRKEAHCA